MPPRQQAIERLASVLQSLASRSPGASEKTVERAVEDGLADREPLLWRDMDYIAASLLDFLGLVAVPAEIVARVRQADAALTRAHSTRDRSDAIAAIASYPIEDDIEAADARLALANHVLEQMKGE